MDLGPRTSEGNLFLKIVVIITIVILNHGRDYNLAIAVTISLQFLILWENMIDTATIAFVMRLP